MNSRLDVFCFLHQKKTSFLDRYNRHMPNGYVQCKGRALCAIIDNYKHVWAWYEAREDYAQRHKHGQRMTLTSNPGPGARFEGHQTNISCILWSAAHAAHAASAAVCVEPHEAGADDSGVIIALQASCELLGLISRCSHLNTMSEVEMQQGMGWNINFTFYILNYPELSIHTDEGDNCFAR